MEEICRTMDDLITLINSFFCNGPGAQGNGEAQASDAAGAPCHGGQDLLAQINMIHQNEKYPNDGTYKTAIGMIFLI
jgi:hypothetical protein